MTNYKHKNDALIPFQLIPLAKSSIFQGYKNEFNILYKYSVGFKIWKAFSYFGCHVGSPPSSQIQFVSQRDFSNMSQYICPFKFLFFVLLAENQLQIIMLLPLYFTVVVIFLG